MIFCRGCGADIHNTARTCPSCGATQRTGDGKNKVVAGLLALFLGGLGIHRFYLGQWWGIFYLLLCWTFLPSLIAFVEAIVFFCSNERNWENKYG
ncbi:NINE protein [Vibrio vulnificus]|nr:NINE protein [Vibrio vulnificus]EJC6822251.1 NINE protein [Vibrio vulnificus]EJC6955929.1 NINE protein [Vibrio vulnificus]EJC6960407.1 NINE protein [Vibrio vulnificus]EKQ3696675.1 NINE protein [Vibrio vulnificus]